MSNEWNGVSMAQEDSEEAGRSGMPVRLITLFSATMALGILACMSEETPTEPAVGASPQLAAVKTYTHRGSGHAGRDLRLRLRHQPRGPGGGRERDSRRGGPRVSVVERGHD